MSNLERGGASTFDGNARCFCTRERECCEGLFIAGITGVESFRKLREGETKARAVVLNGARRQLSKIVGV